MKDMDRVIRAYSFEKGGNYIFTLNPGAPMTQAQIEDTVEKLKIIAGDIGKEFGCKIKFMLLEPDMKVEVVLLRLIDNKGGKK